MGDDNGTREGYCRSEACKKPIVWIIGDNGKWHICNPGRKMFARGAGGRFELVTCYESHFATCPDAKGWRKPKEEEKWPPRDAMDGL